MTHRHRRLTTATALTAAVLTACQSTDQRTPRGPVPGPQVVEVTAVDYAFQAPEEIASGWTTFRMKNAGAEHHFLLLTRLPEGKTLDDYGREVGMPFNIAYDSLKTGAIDKAEAGQLLGQLLPPWYANAPQMGGPGLVAGGGTGETTVNLEPGTYVMECYVKTADGTFHANLGMARELLVTGDSAVGSAPDADVQIRLSNGTISAAGGLAPGQHTVAVHFDEHPAVGLGNDLHLVRLDDVTDMNAVIAWMDWMEIHGLREPAPASFLGGAQEMPVGHTSYFVVDLVPGRYAWISEPGAITGMVREFTVE